MKSSKTIRRFLKNLEFKKKMAYKLLSLYLDILLLCGYTLTIGLKTDVNPFGTEPTGITDVPTSQNPAPRTKRPCICQNGGTCILGSFCTCSSAFKGRYCEERIGNRSCGNFRHDGIQLDFTGDCKLCRCSDGTFICDDQYTCDDLTDYARLNPRINVARGDQEITLSMTDNGESSQDWLFILPHHPYTFSSGYTEPRNGCQYIIYVFLVVTFKFLFFT